MIRRQSTLAFAARHAAPLFPDIAEALDRPMVPDILDTIDQTRGARFIILAPTQVYKTLLAQLRVMRGFLVEPQSRLWYCGTEKAYDDVADEKFNPLFDALPVLHPLLHRRPSGEPDTSKRSRDRIQFDGSSFRFRSANITLDRQSKTAQEITVEEPWTFKSGWLAEISKRRSSYDEAGTWREIYTSTGSVRHAEIGGEFTALWDSSDQRRWHCRCPHCSRLFYPRRTIKDPKTEERIGGLIYETILRPDGLPNEPAIAATVRYRCPNCRKDLPDTPGARLALSGTAARPRGIYVSMNRYATTSPVTIGWQCPSIALKPWAPIVLRMILAELARARGDIEPTKKLVLLDDADIFTESEHFQEGKSKPYGGYKMLEPWDREAIDSEKLRARFAGIDVQHDHFVLTARMWARDSQSRQLFAEKIMTPGILADRLERCGIIRGRTFLDERHEPQRVRQLCSHYGWRAVLGEGEKDYPHEIQVAGTTQTAKVRRIYSEPKLQDPWIGTAAQGISKAKIAEFNFSKPSALGRFALLRSIPRNDGQLHWSIADDTPEWHAKEIDAFHRARKFTSTGEPYDEWIAHGPDHGADGECIGIIAASMADLAGAESLQTAPTPPS